MKHVIIGAGAAGITAAKEIRIHSKNAEITVISADEFIHSRCMLHKYIGGERDEAGLSFVDPDFFEANRIHLIPNVEVTSIDTNENQVFLHGGKRVSYDRLLIASGANSFIPPVGDFRKASNVFGLRHLTDAQAIRAQAVQAERVLIIGSGLVGLDAAYGLLELGKDVTVVEMVPRILPVQLDEHAAYEYQKRFEDAGCRFVLGRKAEQAACDVHGRIHEVVLDNGDAIACDMIIVAAGVRPALTFLDGSGIVTDKGIVVDEKLQTNVTGVYAAGDVTGLSGIWPNAMKQGQTAARNMCGAKTIYDDTYALKNTINFFGLVSLCIGNVQTEDGDAVEVLEDRKVYQRAVLRDGTLTSMLLQGDISHAGIWQYLIKHKIDLSHIEKPVFHLTFADFYGVDACGGYIWTG